MYKHMLSHIFLDYKNSSKCEIHTCLQISCNQGWGNIAGDPFPFFVMTLPTPKFKYGVIGLIIFTLKPWYTDTEGAVEIVHFNLDKI